MKQIDHIVINTRDQMDEAVALCQRMGFIITPRGYHTLGSINHTIVFTSDYLELLGYPAGRPPEKRPELVQRPAGLMATVLNVEDADQAQAILRDRGLSPRPVSAFSRPVDLGNGQSGDAAFRVTRLEPETVPGSWFYYCQQLTPQFVWRPEWQAHPNACVSMTRLAIQVADPLAAAPIYLRALDGAQVAQAGAGACLIKLPSFEIKLTAGEPGMRKLSFATSSLDRTVSALQKGGVPHEINNRCITVEVPQLNCVFDFEAV